MALQKQNIPINFAEGLNTKTDPFQIKPGQFLRLENSVFSNSPRLQKRNGYEELPTDIYNSMTLENSVLGTDVSEGRLVTKFNGEEIISDGFNLFSFSESEQEWAYKGRSTAVTVSDTLVSTSLNGQQMADSAVNSTLGQSLYAWYDPSLGLTYSVLDTETGQILMDQVVASATGSRARCLSLGTSLYLLYVENDDIFGIIITSAGASAPVLIITDLDATDNNYDAIVNNGSIYVAYCAGSDTKVALVNSSLAVTASNTKTADSTGCISLFADSSNNIWVAYGNSSNVSAYILNSTIVTTVLVPTVVDSGAGAQGSYNVTGVYTQSKGFIFYDKIGTPGVGSVIDAYEQLGSNFSFVQPAVGASVTVNFFQATPDRVGQVVYLFSASPGYYRITGAVLNTSYDLENLGISGATPGATVNAYNAGGSPVLYQMVLYDTQYSTAYITFNTLTVGGAVGSSIDFSRSTALASKAFAVETIPHVIGGHYSALQPTYFLLNLYNAVNDPSNYLYANIAGKIAESESGSLPDLPILPAVNVIGSSAQVALLKKTIQYTASEQGTIPTDTDVTTYSKTGVLNVGLDFSLSNPQTQVLGENLHIAMGELVMYDGVNVVEHGFHIYPEGIEASIVGSGGLIALGTYGYQVVYEWRDNKGQVHQSAPSPVLSVVVSADGSTVTLTIPTLSLTNKYGVNIVVYRTTANGTIYYRLNSPANPLANVLNADTVTYSDKANDNNITANQQLYTTGEVENIAAPAPYLLSNFRNRVLLVPSENRYQFWYSKQVVPGSPVEFSDFFVQNVGTTGGEIQAISSMDDKIIIYKPTTIYYMTGTGPAASGANNDFQDPILITTDAGGIDKASIVSMPLGQMFKSQKGIYLIDRSLQATYIGAQVEGYNQYNVVASQLKDKDNQVLYILDSGETLVYDYFYNQWSVFTNTPAVSDVIYNSLHNYIDSNGVVFRETPASYLDGSGPVLMYFKTGWFNFAGLQGFERAYFFYLLGKYLSPHQLLVSVAYDYNDTIQQQVTITPDSSDSIEQWRVFFERMKCQAFQLQIQEVYTGTPGAGLTISGLDLTVGLKDGKPRLQQALSVG